MAGHAQIEHAVGVAHLRQQAAQKRGVGHVQHGHARHGAQDAHVLKGLMGAAVGLGADAGIRSDQFDVGVLIAAGHEHLVGHAARKKGREGMREGDHAVDGEAAGQAGHLRFHDAAVYKALGKRLADDARVHRAAQVRLYFHDARVLPHHFQHRFTIHIPHRRPGVFSISLAFMRSPPCPERRRSRRNASSRPQAARAKCGHGGRDSRFHSRRRPCP